jgi:hypothetical protein
MAQRLRPRRVTEQQQGKKEKYQEGRCASGPVRGIIGRRHSPHYTSRCCLPILGDERRTHAR